MQASQYAKLKGSLAVDFKEHFEIERTQALQIRLERLSDAKETQTNAMRWMFEESSICQISAEQKVGRTEQNAERDYSIKCISSYTKYRKIKTYSGSS